MPVPDNVSWSFDSPAKTWFRGSLFLFQPNYSSSDGEELDLNPDLVGVKSAIDTLTAYERDSQFSVAPLQQKPRPLNASAAPFISNQLVSIQEFTFPTLLSNSTSSTPKQKRKSAKPKQTSSTRSLVDSLRGRNQPAALHNRSQSPLLLVEPNPLASGIFICKDTKSSSSPGTPAPAKFKVSIAARNCVSEDGGLISRLGTPGCEVVDDHKSQIEGDADTDSTSTDAEGWVTFSSDSTSTSTTHSTSHSPCQATSPQVSKTTTNVPLPMSPPVSKPAASDGWILDAAGVQEQGQEEIEARRARTRELFVRLGRVKRGKEDVSESTFLSDGWIDNSVPAASSSIPMVTPTHVKKGINKNKNSWLNNRSQSRNVSTTSIVPPPFIQFQHAQTIYTTHTPVPVPVPFYPARFPYPLGRPAVVHQEQFVISRPPPSQQQYQYNRAVYPSQGGWYFELQK